MERWIQKQQVRFNEVDAAGIVFYPRFFDYFHMAFESFFGACTDAPYHVWIKERRIGWPAVHLESDFLAPLRYGDAFDVCLGFPKVGRSSFVTSYEVRRGEVLCATAELTAVTTDLDRMVSVEMPAVVRQALARFPGG